MMVLHYLRHDAIAPCVDAPDSPGEPNVDEVGGDFVSLTWEKPRSDGGGRIKGYVVEKRDVTSDRWVTPQTPNE